MSTNNNGNVKAHEILNNKDNKKKDTFIFVETEDGNCVLLGEDEITSCENIKHLYGFKGDIIVHKVKLTPQSREIMRAIYCTLGHSSDDIVKALDEFANEMFKIGLSVRGKVAI